MFMSYMFFEMEPPINVGFRFSEDPCLRFQPLNHLENISYSKDSKSLLQTVVPLCIGVAQIMLKMNINKDRPLSKFLCYLLEKSF